MNSASLKRSALVQRIDGRDQRLFGRRPARSVGIFAHGGADLFVGQMRGFGEGRDMHAPFVLAAGSRAGAVDDDLAFPQGERPAVEQAAGAEFLPGAGIAGHHAEQHQRRRAAHDAVEMRLNLRCIRRLQRRDAWRGL